MNARSIAAMSGGQSHISCPGPEAHLPADAEDQTPTSSPPRIAQRPLPLVAKRMGPRDGTETSPAQDPAGELKIRRHRALRKLPPYKTNKLCR